MGFQLGRHIGQSRLSYRFQVFVFRVIVCLLGLGVVVVGNTCSRVTKGNRKVTGKILMSDGAPLGGLQGPAVVRFDPADPEVRETRESIGFIEDNGTFVVMTHEGGDGVPLGEYKVVLTMEKYLDNYKIVPDPYTHYETTPWSATVSAEGDNHFIFEIAQNEE